MENNVYKITMDSNCSHEIKRHLLLGRKARTNLDSILKSRDDILLTQVCMVKAMVFFCRHVWIWALDHKGWARKNWCFWTVVLEKTRESPLDCKEIQPVHPKEISPEYSLEGLNWCWSWNSNILATWYKEPTHWKRPQCWERLKAKGEESSTGWDG